MRGTQKKQRTQGKRWIESEIDRMSMKKIE